MTTPPTHPQLAARFGPLLERIADGALQRDLDRQLPFEQVAELDAAGFGALRVPTEHGGEGVRIVDFTALLIDLAEADPNIAHLYRSHTGFVESLRFLPDDVQAAWYTRVLAGTTVGNASTEKGGNRLGSLNTVLTPTAQGWELNGEKFYATGSIFSDYTRVSAALAEVDGQTQAGRRFALVPTDAPGVSLEDDWDGFGQKLTGTGTARFEKVQLPAEAVLDRTAGSTEAVHEAAFFQLVLLAVLAGIARAARRDAAATVASRARTFNTGLGLPFREDPLIQEAVGRIASQAFAAEATVLHAARALDAALDALAATAATAATDADDADDAASTGATGIPAAFHQAEIAVEHAQVTVPELALRAAQDLFLTVGASATSTAKGLDRHWRNAQTVATHNPIAFRARALGDYWVNGTLPEGLNAIGDATSSSTSGPQPTNQPAAAQESTR